MSPARPRPSITRSQAHGSAASPSERHKVADLQSVMRLIDDRLLDITVEIPERKRPLLANALLNLAVERILGDEGPDVTAAILQRLTDLIRSGAKPEDDDVFRLTRHDA